MVSFMQKIVVEYTPASELSLEEMNLLSSISFEGGRRFKE